MTLAARGFGDPDEVREFPMRVVMDDGAEGEAPPGDVFVISPGHDAWIVGNEPCVFLDFSGMETYAKGEK
jgi:hypothetical protein